MVGSAARQFVMLGFCGGFTTFSSFSLQTLTLINDGEWLRAGRQCRLSVALCLVAVWLGHMCWRASLNTSWMGVVMTGSAQAVLLRIFLGEDDRIGIGRSTRRSC